MMLRPAIVWTLFLACAVAVIAALGLLTRHAQMLEIAGRESVAEADLATRTRLALWRMDTSASSLLAIENNRPPSQFLAFPDAFRSPDASPSPLLKEIPDYARLHFQIDENGTWSSPQVPDDISRALRLGISESRLLQSAARLKEIQGNVPSAKLVAELATNLETRRRDRDAMADLADSAMESYRAAVPPELKKSETVSRLTEDQMQRADVVGKASRQGEYAQNAKSPGARREVSSSELRSQSASAGSVPTQSAAAPAEEVSSLDSSKDQRTGLMDATAGSSSYKALWVNGELLLCRNVTQRGREFTQGVWLDADALGEALLAAARDVLPDARLVSSDLENAGPLGLVTLPYRLNPGSAPPVSAALLPQPVQGFVTLAWAACLLMLLVAGVLIAGVLQLGERRATFVSSVTHELRTPLTTFRLYAEMLAGKMVPDEARRQQYLETLRGEAERLSHLVENVLAYSRIERGSARGKVESMVLEELLARIVPRLTDRMNDCGMHLETTISPEVASQIMEIDPTAVEQILFNLIDNACKYGMPSDGPARLELKADLRAGRRSSVMLSVRDFGSGIARREQKRLFRPFHKSASDAAHSQPGVGLGLALSRRLARALGGDLRYHASEPGTTFTLELPTPRDRG